MVINCTKYLHKARLFDLILLRSSYLYMMFSMIGRYLTCLIRSVDTICTYVCMIVGI